MSLKERRESAKLTQLELAMALEVARTTVAMWENGSTNPRASLLPKIAKILGCSIDELLSEDTADEGS